MSAVFGQVGEYKDEEDWLSYVERLEHFFKANKIESKQWLSVFLSTIGAPTYKVLKSVVAPKKPDDKDLGTLAEALQGYFSPKPSQTMQRFKFHRRNRLPGESITEYVAHLRSLLGKASSGPFGTTCCETGWFAGLKIQLFKKDCCPNVH